MALNGIRKLTNTTEQIKLAFFYNIKTPSQNAAQSTWLSLSFVQINAWLFLVCGSILMENYDGALSCCPVLLLTGVPKLTRQPKYTLNKSCGICHMNVCFCHEQKYLNIFFCFLLPHQSGDTLMSCRYL